MARDFQSNAKYKKIQKIKRIKIKQKPSATQPQQLQLWLKCNPSGAKKKHGRQTIDSVAGSAAKCRRSAAALSTPAARHGLWTLDFNALADRVHVSVSLSASFSNSLCPLSTLHSPLHYPTQKPKHCEIHTRLSSCEFCWWQRFRYMCFYTTLFFAFLFFIYFFCFLIYVYKHWGELQYDHFIQFELLVCIYIWIV